MMKHAPTTTPPICSTRPQIASTVPPVASTSSWITTRDARRDQIRMHLEDVLAVLEQVGRADGLRRKLARPPRRDEARARLRRDRGAEDEAPGLGAEHEIGVPRRHPARQVGDRLIQRDRVGEQRRDVLEPDPGGREVLNLANPAAEIDGRHRAAISRTSRQRSNAASSCASSVSACRSDEPRGAPLVVAGA